MRRSSLFWMGFQFRSSCWSILSIFDFIRISHGSEQGNKFVGFVTMCYLHRRLWIQDLSNPTSTVLATDTSNTELLLFHITSHRSSLPHHKLCRLCCFEQQRATWGYLFVHFPWYYVSTTVSMKLREPGSRLNKDMCCTTFVFSRARFKFIVWHVQSKCVQCSSKGNSTLRKTRRLWYHAPIGNAHIAALASKNCFAFLFSSSSSSLSLEFTELLDLRLSRARFLGSISSRLQPWNTCDDHSEERHPSQIQIIVRYSLHIRNGIPFEGNELFGTQHFVLSNPVHSHRWASGTLLGSDPGDDGEDIDPEEKWFEGGDTNVDSLDRCRKGLPVFPDSDDKWVVVWVWGRIDVLKFDTVHTKQCCAVCHFLPML